MRYKIIISKYALKELSKLPQINREKIAIEIDALSENPRPIGCIKLKGKSEVLWRIVVGDFRVLYSIEDKIKIVEVRKVGDRKEVYKH
ncbi:MAG: type II toxin-antitoxin system RelE/ParE family toxin [Bacteroidia bacterium]